MMKTKHNIFNVKKRLIFLAMNLFIFLSFSCKKEEMIMEVENSANRIVNTNIIGNVKWSRDTIYELTSRIVVEPKSILVIESGTIIKAQNGDGANAAVLIVARGAKIHARGEPNRPIIFTSVADQIKPGQIESPNLDETDSRLWGGVIILGAAPISDESNSGNEQIEGIPGQESLAEYGGDIEDDNSGVFQYVSIRHGGTFLSDNNEINGLTLGGVGSRTTINNIEIVGNADDGIEFFGGTVNVTNLLLWAADDDALDIDQAYSGTIDNVVIICTAGTDHALEVDGPEGKNKGRFTLQNITIKGNNNEIADFRDGASGIIKRAYFFDFVSPLTDINGSEEGGTGLGDLEIQDNAIDQYYNDELSFSLMEITLANDVELNDVFPNFGVEDVKTTIEVQKNKNTLGADVSVFEWTFASLKGELNDF